jgi:hypothetical protein
MERARNRKKTKILLFKVNRGKVYCYTLIWIVSQVLSLLLVSLYFKVFEVL